MPRTAVAIGIAVFVVLSGTGTASALWSTANSTLTTSATAGTLAFTQTGANGLAKVYAPGNLVDFAPITVKNTGTVPDDFSYRLVARNGNNLANATTITGWVVGSTAACTETPPSGAATTSASLATGITMTGPTTAAGASIIYCVRTSVTDATARSTGAGSEINAVFSAAIGSWTSASAGIVANQSVAPDTAKPSAPSTLAASSTTSTQTTLTWAAATDNFGVTGYRVYRAGIAIAEVTGRSYTNTGLVGGTNYSYTVRAFDAAGNESVDSNSITVTTPANRYRLKNPNSGLCVDAENGGTADGTRLVISNCTTGSSQVWRFTPTSDGYVKITPQYSDVLSWDIDNATGGGMDDYAKAQLWGYAGTANQQWQVVQETGDNVHFVNRASGKCLDINGATNVPGTQLQQHSCNNTVAQTFTRTVIG